MRTAAAIGDDTLQQQAQGYVVPDCFTHGIAEQRQRWFKTGYPVGRGLQHVHTAQLVSSCNTILHRAQTLDPACEPR